jgi:rhodanese-related sulfurtransferase
MKQLSAKELSAFQSGNTTFVDLRDAVPFGAGHLTGSVHIKARSPDFAERIDRFIAAGSAIIFLADTEEDAAWAKATVSLARTDTVEGYVLAESAFANSPNVLRSLPNLLPTELEHARSVNDDVVVLDVREHDEWRNGNIPGAIHVPMWEVLDRVDELPRERPIAIVCAGGQRSSLIGSLLLNRGFTNLINVTGGMKSWTTASLPVEK